MMDTIQAEIAVQHRDSAVLVDGPHPADLPAVSTGTACAAGPPPQEGKAGGHRKQCAQRADIAAEKPALQFFQKENQQKNPQRKKCQVIIFLIKGQDGRLEKGVHRFGCSVDPSRGLLIGVGEKGCGQGV